MKELDSYRGVLATPLIDAWPHVAAVVPDDGILMGGTALALRIRHRVSRDLDLFTTDSFDPYEIERRLLSRGRFVTDHRDQGTLDGTFEGARIQILWARGQKVLAPPTVMAGMRVGSLQDIVATKLNAISGRAQLRDYFDLMCIEQTADLRVEEGLQLFMDRFAVDSAHPSVSAVLRGLGFFDDVPEDPGLEESQGRGTRSRVVNYWTRRQQQIISSFGTAL